MPNDIDALQKALEAGSYAAAPGQLEHGSALQVEDLDVILKCVTFYCPTLLTVAEYNRLLSNLRKRNIRFAAHEYTDKHWLIRTKEVRNIRLRVGKRKLHIQLEG